MKEKQSFEIGQLPDNLLQPGAAQSLFRDFAATARSYLESIQMQEQATNAREKQIADEAYRQREQALQLIRQQFDQMKHADTHALETDKFEEMKRIQQENERIEKERQESLKELKAEYARAHAEYYDIESELNDAIREGADPTEIQRLKLRLTKIGGWLQLNAERAEAPEFTRFNKFLESDDEAREQAEIDKEQAAQTERTRQYINNPENFPDEATRNRLNNLLDAYPEKDIDELIELANEAKIKEDKTSEIREAKQKIWNDNKDAIVEKYGDDAIWHAVNSELQLSTDPEKVDIKKYLEKPKEDNPHIIAGNDAYEAAKELGKPEEEAQAAKRKAIVDSLNKVGNGALIERVFDGIDEITVPIGASEEQTKFITDLKTYIESSAIRTLSSRKVTSNLLALTRQAVRGEFNEVLENLGEIWTNYERSDRLAGVRMQDAMIYQNMRNMLLELKDMGIETNRLTQAYVNEMSAGRIANAFKQKIFDFTGLNLTPKQKQKVAELESYMKRDFASFLLNLSGTAASDEERRNLVAITPNVFMAKEVNIGVINGAIKYLRDREFALFREQSNPEFAARVMAAKGWGDITTSDEEQDTQEFIANDLTILASAAVKANVTREVFISHWKDNTGKTEKELGKIYDEAVNAAKEAAPPAEE